MYALSAPRGSNAGYWYVSYMPPSPWSVANHRNTHAALRSGRRHTSRNATSGAAIIAATLKMNRRSRCHAPSWTGGTTMLKMRPARVIVSVNGRFGQLLRLRYSSMSPELENSTPSMPRSSSPRSSRNLAGGPITRSTLGNPWPRTQFNVTPRRW